GQAGRARADDQDLTDVTHAPCSPFSDDYMTPPSREGMRAGKVKRPRGSLPGAADLLGIPLLLGDVGRLLALGALHDVELHRLALRQRAEARALDGGVMDEDVLSAGAFDETVPLGLVEPLHHAAFTHSFGLLPWDWGLAANKKTARAFREPLRRDRT